MRSACGEAVSSPSWGTCTTSDCPSRIRESNDGSVQQFDQICKTDGQAGRRLDFLSQEMLREINTVASKSSDAEIARSVVDIKCLIERLKEQIQNAE